MVNNDMVMFVVPARQDIAQETMARCLGNLMRITFDRNSIEIVGIMMKDITTMAIWTVPMICLILQLATIMRRFRSLEAWIQETVLNIVHYTRVTKHTTG
jgi:hypothetical protein